MTAPAISKGTRNTRLIGLALTTALASATLTGCAASAPPASLSAGKAQAALAHGDHSQAIDHAEAAVMADGRNASYRAVLGTAYLESGRFASAATAFDDAMKLGDTSPRTALSLSLALSANGKYREAISVLHDNESTIAAGDLGLAYSLAGRPDRGISILSNALRNGQNTPKIRQNLAYSFALAGRWREARLMVAEDVPADQVGDRIAEWASQTQPTAYRTRVAALLSVKVDNADPGEPVQLALANFPTAEQLAAQAADTAPAAASAPAQAAAPAAAPAAVAQNSPPAAPVYQDRNPAPVQSSELPPVGDPVNASDAGTPVYTAKGSQQPSVFRTAFRSPEQAAVAAPAPAPAMDAQRFISKPVVEPVPSRTAAATKRNIFAVSSSSEGSHLVQLGSFSSEAGARRAWGIYVKRYPELAQHDMVITRAVVRGKNYWRVSAAGYDARSSRAMCGHVNSVSDEGCFAYAESHPLPGAIDAGQRFAMR
jgi:Flp pilus assembly protein TadD